MGVFTKISNDLHTFFHSDSVLQTETGQLRDNLLSFFDSWIAVNADALEKERQKLRKLVERKGNQEETGDSRETQRNQFTIGREDDSFDIEDEITVRSKSMDVWTQCGPGDFGYEEVKSDELKGQGIGSESMRAVETETEEVSTTGGRPLDDIRAAWKSNESVTPGEALRLLNRAFAKHRELEAHLPAVDAVAVRRAFIGKNIFKTLPFKNYDYKYIMNSCCENVIGLLPLPVGIAGPLLVNDYTAYVPMATTEGALVASTNRGCRVLEMSSGVKAHVKEIGMTRAPVVRFDTAMEVVQMEEWIKKSQNYEALKKEFEATSKFADLREVEVVQDGNLAFIRFVAGTGDAMGMNMVSKGTSAAIKFLNKQFPAMKLISLSGNYCVDKKASAINFVKGRGRQVTVEAIVPASVCEKLLHTTPQAMAEAAAAKLRVGSDRAVCIGGNNSHAANIVTAIFLATGQDPAQVITSSMCSVRMEVNSSGDLYVSATLPCLEVGTVGGGTILPPQSECLKLLSCQGPCLTEPGRHASRLAEVIGSTVLAGELSLMAALVTDELVSSHMKLNRSRLDLYPAHTSSGPRPLTIDGVDISQRLINKPAHSKSYASQNSNCSNIL